MWGEKERTKERKKLRNEEIQREVQRVDLNLKLVNIFCQFRVV